MVCEDFMWLWQQRKNLLPRTVVPPPTAEEQQARRFGVMDMMWTSDDYSSDLRC